MIITNVSLRRSFYKDTSVFKMCVKNLIYDGASLEDVEMCKRRRLFIKNTTVSGQKHEHVYFRL